MPDMPSPFESMQGAPNTVHGAAPAFPEEYDFLSTGFSSSRVPGTVRAGFLSALIVTLGLALAVAAGLTYNYLRRDITLVVAGRAVHKTTFKRTVAQLLAEAGVSLDPNDEVSLAVHTRIPEGATVVVRRAVPVTIVADGQTVQVSSAAASVGDLLARRGVSLTQWDRVFPSREAPLTKGLKIRVVRIQHKMVTEQIEIPYQVQAAKDPATPRGIVRVKMPGRTGLKERVFKITLADGVVVEEPLIGERIIRTPLDRVISIGARILIASRGQFAGKEYMDMLATAYSPFCCKGVDDVTAIGVLAGYGVVAVDPTIIPLGSRLFIEGYGYALAGDTGSVIKGLRIDLGFNSKQEAIRFGRRPVRVYIVERKEKR